LLQLDFASSKPVSPEGSTEASATPAANFFGVKNTGGKAEQGAEGFARSLEKAQKAVKGGVLGSKPDEGLEEAADTKQGELALIHPGEIAETIRELLGGLNERQLVRVLMQIDPAQLLRYAESLGLDSAALLASTETSDSEPAEGKWQLNRGRLVHLLRQLTELLGEQSVADAIAVTAGKKRLLVPQSPELDAGGGMKNREIGEARKVGKKPAVVVLDLRKEQPAPKEVQEQPNSVKNSFTPTVQRTAEAQGRDASVLFRAPLQDRAQTPVLEASVRTSRATANFEQRFIPEVVKQTGIILKEGGNGEIRLVLKPENLGSLRIRVALSESSLEGRIVVDNNSVKELVESSLDNLKNALRLEGYQTNLEVSVGHRRSWGGDEQAQTRPTGWLASGSEEFDKAIPLYLDMKPDYELVNLFA
jgi:flagellar hook-length control protein FliK